MPIYEFECWYCHAVTERIEPLNTTSIQCPKCGSYAHKQLSTVNFRITGFSARNGYNVPSQSDVLNPDGTAKPKWSRD